jgi:hypothetical protein
MTLYLVTGPPAAGKSTWVREHARRGDITIDFDSLAGVLTPDGDGELPESVLVVTLAARQAAIDAAVDAAVDVYVIHATPSQAVLDRYAKLNATVVTVDPGEDVVMARCRQERSRRLQDVAAQWYRSPSWVRPDW